MDPLYGTYLFYESSNHTCSKRHKHFENRLWLGKSEIVKRNFSLLSTSKGIPSKDFEKYKPEKLIYEVLPDLFVRSEGERMISKALAEAEIGFFYEKPLIAKDNKSSKLPDLTFIVQSKRILLGT